ncbi:hypothetical protein FB567DRAFT_208881 [Paraphoma chrysanthemicola]|uniref:Secreted protein n=1 Tax=Paraphoma chrysanthemicola TaxID=798071 RepID=A0A8K0QUA4_9PLEO|nr:hypothetical protein FB567DRAFT_208881 [Paraphoma chrysanthemicola]
MIVLESNATVVLITLCSVLSMEQVLARGKTLLKAPLSGSKRIFSFEGLKQSTIQKRIRSSISGGLSCTRTRPSIYDPASAHWYHIDCTISPSLDAGMPKADTQPPVSNVHVSPSLMLWYRNPIRCIIEFRR